MAVCLTAALLLYGHQATTAAPQQQVGPDVLQAAATSKGHGQLQLLSQELQHLLHPCCPSNSEAIQHRPPQQHSRSSERKCLQ